MDLGASYFLTKPVEENALLDRMRALFSRGAPVEEHPAELKNLGLDELTPFVALHLRHVIAYRKDKRVSRQKWLDDWKAAP